MPPKLQKNVLITLVNVGRTSLEQAFLEDEPFIDKAKYAIKMLIEKKIFMQPKDEIGIITMGDETDNPNQVDYVRIYNEHLLVSNWDMIKYVDGLEATSCPCNWIEALHVALSYSKREVLDPNVKIFLVIFNNFKEDPDFIVRYDSDCIAEELLNFENLYLLFVGERPFDVLVSDLNPSEKFFFKLMNQVDAQYEQLNSFIEKRRFYNVNPTNPLAWKFYLKWNNLSIPCAEFVKIADVDKYAVQWQITSNGSDNCLNNSAKLENLIINREYFDQNKTETNADNVAHAYLFGGKLVPISEEDEDAMKYEETEKGMIVYGFVHREEVKIKYFDGNGSRIVVPESNVNSTAFYSLVQAMVETSQVAIVRKVHIDGKAPKMGVLFPKIDDNEIWCLIHIEFPFAEDISYIDEKPIVKIEQDVDKEKLDALDKFIDSMTISESEVDYLNPGQFPNVQNQYLWNAIAYRALNPSGQLIPVNDYLKKYLEPPEFLKKNAVPYIEKLNVLFKDCKDIEDEVEEMSVIVEKNDKENVEKACKCIPENINLTDTLFSKDFED